MTKRPVMSDIPDDLIPFASSSLGLLHASREISNNSLGRLSYKDLTAYEFEAITYLNGQIDNLQGMMGRR